MLKLLLILSHIAAAQGLSTDVPTETVKAVVVDGVVVKVSNGQSVIVQDASAAVKQGDLVSGSLFASQPTVTDVVTSTGVMMTAKFYNGAVGPVSIQWNKDGKPIPGENGQALTILPTIPGDTGIYTYTITNGKDSVESPAINFSK